MANIELVPDILDREHCCLTCWDVADWQAVKAVNQTLLPAQIREQPYYEDNKLIGIGFYYLLSSLPAIEVWLSKTARRYSVKVLYPNLLHFEKGKSSGLGKKAVDLPVYLKSRKAS